MMRRIRSAEFRLCEGRLYSRLDEIIMDRGVSRDTYGELCDRIIPHEPYHLMFYSCHVFGERNDA